MDFITAAEAAATKLQDASAETRLRIYALYKQATVGDQPTSMSRPSSYRIVDCKKYDAWAALRGTMTQTQAKDAYVALVTSLLSSPPSSSAAPAADDLSPAITLHSPPDTSSSSSPPEPQQQQQQQQLDQPKPQTLPPSSPSPQPFNYLSTTGCVLAYFFLLGTHDGPITLSMLIWYALAISIIMLIVVHVTALDEN